jgi:DNA-binding NarL/FixJ family response regulator
MIRILLVDDHPVVREGLTAILAAEPDFNVVGEAGSGEDAIRIVAELDPDVLVIDVRLPGISGIETCEHLLARDPRLRVVILSSAPDNGTMIAAYTAGARGFLIKECEPSVLRQAVRIVADGDTYVDPRVASKLVALATKGRSVRGPHGLTVQEMRVLEHLPRGLSNREIGKSLHISENTVKTHLRHAMAKLGARDRVEAAALAMREGLA